MENLTGQLNLACRYIDGLSWSFWFDMEYELVINYERIAKNREVPLIAVFSYRFAILEDLPIYL